MRPISKAFVLSSILAFSLAAPLDQPPPSIPVDLIQALFSTADPPRPADQKPVTFPTALVSPPEIASFKPFTQFARAGYCSLADVKTWTCGAACNANPDFVVYLTGGNGKDIPNFFVGFSPSLHSVVVVHEGTDPNEPESIQISADSSLDQLNPAFFPGIHQDVKVHNGFSIAHEKSIAYIISAVTTIISERGVDKVALVGHSLGGALAVLDAVSLKSILPGHITFTVVTYGQPRVGNPALANFVDHYIDHYARVTNLLDPVPLVAGRTFGFGHSSSEKHVIGGAGGSTWVACDGQENEAEHCSLGAIDNIQNSSILDHSGPYDGVFIGSDFCTP